MSTATASWLQCVAEAHGVRAIVGLAANEPTFFGFE
jgi:hypothetical protein